MSNFLKMVSSNNFINTIEHEPNNLKYNIENQQIDTPVSFKQMELKEVATTSPSISIANMLFV